MKRLKLSKSEKLEVRNLIKLEMEGMCDLFHGLARDLDKEINVDTDDGTGLAQDYIDTILVIRHLYDESPEFASKFNEMDSVPRDFLYDRMQGLS